MLETSPFTALSDPALLRKACYINGTWHQAGERRLDVSDPASGKVIAHVPYFGAEETRLAIDSAAAAFPAWRDKTSRERAVLLERWYDLMHAHSDDLALIMTVEQGKPLAEAKGEITYAASFLKWFAEEGRRLYGDTIPTHDPDKRILTIRQPIGVVASITPWNFPAAMITRKAGPALASGCTFVGKPASATPLSALALAELADRAGIPAGVFNIITGSAREIGGEMTSNPIVRKLTFTGSTEIGKELIRQCAGTVKRVSMELGGNAPFIVFDDADVDAAVIGAIACKFRNTGQTCVCANRIYVQSGVYDAFCDKLAAAIATLKVGHGLDDSTTVGPLIDDAAVAKVEEHIADATDKGGRILCGGRRHALGGRFFEPTLLRDATAAMTVSREETFGPLAPLFRFETEAEAISMANDTEFGLAAYFYARDMGRVMRVAEALESGMVAINSGILSTEVAPFGGVKESGIGREGGHQGIDEFVETKYILLSGIL